MLLAQANPLMIPAQNGNTCPGGTSYAGAGYCKVRGSSQYFPDVTPFAAPVLMRASGLIRPPSIAG